MRGVNSWPVFGNAAGKGSNASHAGRSLGETAACDHSATQRKRKRTTKESVAMPPALAAALETPSCHRCCCCCRCDIAAAPLGPPGMPESGECRRRISSVDCRCCCDVPPPPPHRPRLPFLLFFFLFPLLLLPFLHLQTMRRRPVGMATRPTFETGTPISSPIARCCFEHRCCKKGTA